MIRKMLLALGCSLFAMSANATLVIDFEEFNPPSGSSTVIGAFSSQGYDFSPFSGDLLIVDNDQPNVPNTGSNTLVANAGFPASFLMKSSSGAPFDLLSVLALEGRNTNTGFFQFSAHEIDVIGKFHAGGTISTTLTLDLFAEENNLLDAQEFLFAGFTNLKSVRFTGVGGNQDGYSFALDNIQVAESRTVPAPGIAGLLLAGLVGIGALRRRLS